MMQFAGRWIARFGGVGSVLLALLVGCPASPAAAGSVVYEVYRVKPNDNLDSIARIYGTSVAELRSLNPFLSTRSPMEGEMLTVPMHRSDPAHPPVLPPETPGAAGTATPQPAPPSGAQPGANGAVAPGASTVPSATAAAASALPAAQPIDSPAGLYKTFTDNGAAGRYGYVRSGDTPIYRERSTDAGVLFLAEAETGLVVVAQENDWYKVAMADGSRGYVPMQFVQLTTRELVQVPTQQPAATARGVAIVQEAYRYLGVPYRWGGNGFSGIDCSGLVLAAYRSQGLGLPRVSRDQFNVGQSVPYDQLQPGDRLYFASGRRQIDHTGLYIGNGYFIHASGGRRQVCIDNLFTPKWWGIYVGAKRSG